MSAGETATEQDGPCGAFVAATGERCLKENDHDGPHVFSSDLLLPFLRMPVSNLKCLNAKKLRTLGTAIVIERHSEPLAVVVPMEWYSVVVDLFASSSGG